MFDEIQFKKTIRKLINNSFQRNMIFSMGSLLYHLDEDASFKTNNIIFNYLRDDPCSFFLAIKDKNVANLWKIVIAAGRTISHTHLEGPPFMLVKEHPRKTLYGYVYIDSEYKVLFHNLELEEITPDSTNNIHELADHILNHEFIEPYKTKTATEKEEMLYGYISNQSNYLSPLPYIPDSAPSLRDYIIIQIISDEENVKNIMGNSELKLKFEAYIKHPIENSLDFSIALISNF